MAEQLRPQDAVQPSATPQVAYMQLDGVVPVTREELGDEELACARVEQGQGRQVVQALGFLHPSGAQAQEKLQELIGYLQNNLDRMDYPSYRARACASVVARWRARTSMSQARG